MCHGLIIAHSVVNFSWYDSFLRKFNVSIMIIYTKINSPANSPALYQKARGMYSIAFFIFNYQW